jgi:L-ascorbate metabolism protein UlaG (beta-lactamase superfamily)
MEITWHGHSCFRLIERGLASVVTDPYDDSAGYGTLRLKADVVTVSHDAPGHNYVSAVKGVAHTLTGPGEYEIGGVFITGLATESDRKRKADEALRNTLYLLDFDGLTVCHLGNMDRVPTQAQIEALGSSVDIVLVPVGGGEALNAAQAAEVVSLLDPSIVIPMHYRTEANKAVKLDPVSKFLKEMGLSETTPEPGLKMTKSALPKEIRIVLLEARAG